MSLVTLTFGGQNVIDGNYISKGKVKIIKTEKFVGTSEVCVIGKLVEGSVSKKMLVTGRDNCQVVSVESKYGDGFCTKEGAQVVMMISGITKEEYGSGTEILLEKGFEMSAVKPKGRLIIA